MLNFGLYPTHLLSLLTLDNDLLTSPSCIGINLFFDNMPVNQIYDRRNWSLYDSSKLRHDGIRVADYNKQSSINSEYLNSHFLFIHHWNNSIISYNLNWERKNDVFDYGLSKSLNFLHI